MEIKPIQKIQKEYYILLKKYEKAFLYNSVTNDEIKMLIEDVLLFWYKHNSYVSYFLNNISIHDKVAYLSGAVRLDIKNNGHYEFGILGNYRIVNEPFLKMKDFYQNSVDKLNYLYVNQYITDTYIDVMGILEKYTDDFWILPLELIFENDRKSHFNAALDIAEKLFFQFFKEPINSMKEFYNTYPTYEEIEKGLVPNAKNHIIFNDFQDINLSIRERVEKFMQANQEVLPDICLSESEKYAMFTCQHLMEILNIMNLMIEYNMCPFIRSDVVFSYFLLLYSNYTDIVDYEIAFEVFIGFVSQKEFDFSDFEYNIFKKDFMGRKLVTYITKQKKFQGRDLLQIHIPELVTAISKFVDLVKNVDN